MRRTTRLRFVLGSACIAGLCAYLAMSPVTLVSDVSEPEQTSDTYSGIHEEPTNNSPVHATDDTEKPHEHDKRVHSQTAERAIVLDGIQTDLESGESLVQYKQEGTVQSVAAQLLRSYQKAGDCALVRSEQLDLLGNTWACVISGNGWIEMAFVQGEADEAVCNVRIVRLKTDTDDVGVSGEQQ